MNHDKRILMIDNSTILLLIVRPIMSPLVKKLYLWIKFKLNVYQYIIDSLVSPFTL